MANDHYVARTYLKHFVGPSGMLCAYRKSDGKNFPCWPRDVCFERNGDIIPDFLSEPGYLGEYRSVFEPHWDVAVTALKARRPDQGVKAHVAGYWANLMVCTPTWKRIAVETSNQRVHHFVTAYDDLSAKIGKPNRELTEAVAALNRGEIRIDTESDYVRAENAKNGSMRVGTVQL
jgi:hypothetical protein